ncbi:MAG: hypothetical protein JWO03_1879, partial [Bacteroidetes bacterium]|nr:hypothetical protein [Bacteroidota bacterium]
MRIFLSCLITAFSFSIGYAQTTAMDWTRNDCDSNISHHLFAELDSGYVVQIDFDMIPTCPTCNASVHTLKPMLDDKRNQYPNRLKYYCVGYDDSYTCSQMLNWKSAQSVDAPVFTGGAT